MPRLTSLESVIRRLQHHEISATALLEERLGRIEDQADNAVFTQLFTRTAHAQATAADGLRAAGALTAPLAGAPMAIKDLFDVVGYHTRAGSQVLAQAAPAGEDATAVARLRQAGAVLVGHTNMTEFAYSGVGINPHYGTPRNPFDRERIAGGSSSGAAVSVAEGMACAALGTDTGGSIRIPAALCGLAGFKPSHGRIPLQGVVPLSPSLDSIGTIAPSIVDCAFLDAILSGGSPSAVPSAGGNRPLHLALPQTYVLEGLDKTVSDAFFGAVDKLRASGVIITESAFSNLAELPDLLTGGGVCAAEAYHWHRKLLQSDGQRYDPRVRSRLLQGENMIAADYLTLVQERTRQCHIMDQAMQSVDALVLPTTACVAARVSEFERDTDYDRLNLLLLRNTSVANQLNLCAATLPCHAPDELPVGFMIMGRHGDDARILAIAQQLEHRL